MGQVHSMTLKTTSLQSNLLCVPCFQIQHKESTFNCTKLHTVPARTEAFIICWNEFFYSLLIEVSVLCYQPLYRNCFQLAVIFNPLNAELNPVCHLLTLIEAQHILHISRIRFKSVSAKVLLWLTQMEMNDNCLAINYFDTSMISVCCVVMKLFSMSIYFLTDTPIRTIT